MATLVKLTVTVTPVGKPWVRVTAPGFSRYTQLQESTQIDIHFHTTNTLETLTIEHVNKATDDATTAVIIDSVSFFGIRDPKFAWAGVYRPNYPEPWASEQTNLASELSPHTYLGWNGCWSLTFGVPVFTWIHQTQNLGWIYG
tara:strand:- start:1003 stop:1431 length:429 start_codon:yes stop_codon:yes gene_type:complete